MTHTLHEPSPEFERFLEWQVTTAARRQDRFDVPETRSGLRRYLGVAALAVLSMFVGAAGVTASDRIQENRQTEVLLTQQRAEIKLAELQVQLARDAVERAKQRVDVGVAAPDVVADAQAALAQAMARLERTQLNIDEVQRSGRPVQDDITAPTVNARDYVSDRLRLDLRSAAAAIETTRQHMAEVRKRYDVGLASDLDVRQAQADVQRIAQELAELQAQLDVRRRFVAGDLTAEAATDARQRVLAESQLRIAEQDLEVASARLTFVQKQIKVGVISGDDVDALRAQLDVVSKRADVERLKARLAMLKSGK